MHMENTRKCTKIKMAVTKILTAMPKIETAMTITEIEINDKY